MGFWVVILNRMNWWSTVDPTMYGGVTFKIINYMSRTRFEGIIGYLYYTDKKDVEYYDGFFHMRQIEEAWNLNMAE